jgi:hypothetical protein
MSSNGNTPEASAIQVADLGPILKELGLISRSLAVIAAGLSPLKSDEKIQMLTTLGFDRSTIAVIVGVSAKTVSNRASEARTGKGRAHKQHGKEN